MAGIPPLPRARESPPLPATALQGPELVSQRIGGGPPSSASAPQFSSTCTSGQLHGSTEPYDPFACDAAPVEQQQCSASRGRAATLGPVCLPAGQPHCPPHHGHGCFQPPACAAGMPAHLAQQRMLHVTVGAGAQSRPPPLPHQQLDYLPRHPHRAPPGCGMLQMELSGPSPGHPSLLSKRPCLGGINPGTTEPLTALPPEGHRAAHAGLQVRTGHGQDCQGTQVAGSPRSPRMQGSGALDAGLPPAATTGHAHEGCVTPEGFGVEELFYQQLSRELEAFCQGVALTPAEAAQREGVLRGVRAAVMAALPEYQAWGLKVDLFGSAASGLNTHASDLDVVITGVAQMNSAGSFDPAVKRWVVTMLRRVMQQLRASPQLQLEHCQLIAAARVPVIRATVSDGVQLDLSIGDEGGPRAAAWTHQRVLSIPALAPLVLVLKSALKQRGLADVSTGGLGGWALINVVLAHLQHEHKAAVCSGGAAAAAAAEAAPSFLGRVLHGMLRRYGMSFDYMEEAVAVARGGHVPKHLLPKLDWGFKLGVEDPLTGRDVSGGTHRIADVIAEWADAATRLSEQLEQWRLDSCQHQAPGIRSMDVSARTSTSNAVRGDAASAGNGRAGSLLDCILDTQRALQRVPLEPVKDGSTVTLGKRRRGEEVDYRRVPPPGCRDGLQ